MSTSDGSNIYTADHRLAMLLKAAARSGVPLQVQAEDTTFELAVRPAQDAGDIWNDYDPQAAREAWHSIAGLLSEADADALIEELKLDREQRPATWSLR
jgi:hypothetical protein